MEKILKKIGTISNFASRYIGIIIIVFSCLAFFWRDGFAWMTNYTSVFLGVIMFGMGLTIRMEDFRAIFSRPKEVVIGAVAQYTIMPVIAWLLCKVMNLPADLALGVILVGCCPGGTASNVITYIAGGDVALSVGMTIVSTLAAPLMTPFLVYVLAGAWVEVSFWAMVLSVVKVILVPVLLGVFLRSLAGEHVDKVSDVMPLVSVVAIVMIIGGIVAVNAEKIVSCGVLVLGCGYPQFLRYDAGASCCKNLPRGVCKDNCHSHRSGHAEQRPGSFSGSSQFCGQSAGYTTGSDLQRMA